MKPDFFDLFDECYIINLAYREDRRNEVIKQFENIEINLVDNRISFFDAVRPDNPGSFPNIGALGCFMSHLGILRKAIEKKQNRIAILEDDLNFSADFTEQNIPMLKKLRKDNWGIFYGGYELKNQIKAPIKDNLFLVPAEVSIRTAHFICFQGNTIKKAEAYLTALMARPGGDPAGGPMHVDGAYTWFRKDNSDILTLAANPQLGYQRSSRTDIHDLRWIDTVPIVRKIVAKLRIIKQRFR